MTPSIAVRNLCKSYELGSPRGSQRTTDLVRSLLSREASQPYDILAALDDVSFDIEQGEVVGLVGHNGAGKSTLLKIMSRVTAPDSGSVTLRGRVGSLLEVGTGFHPELTGRENVFLNGAILGMRRSEISHHLDEIVAFAEVERFIDTPVKRYSSGMYMRLAFAVAAHLETEIMLVDEVLSVGDASFQAKSLGKMDAMADSGRTVVYVSHNLASMKRLCTRGIWIDHGRVCATGSIAEVVAAYVTTVHEGRDALVFDPNEDLPAQFHSIAVYATDATGETTDGPISLSVGIQIRNLLPGFHFSVALQSAEGTIVLHSDVTDTLPDALDSLAPGIHSFRVELPPKLLAPGQYTVFLGMAATYVGMLDRRPRALSFNVIDTSSTFSREQPGVIGLPMKWTYDGSDDQQG